MLYKIFARNYIKINCNWRTRNYSTKKVKETADFLKSEIRVKPKVLIICGSGIGHVAKAITNSVQIKYSKIPHFPVSKVAGHAGQMVVGTLNNTTVICMQGRFHYYEGHSLMTVAMPVRVAKLLGVKFLLTTSAVGGVNLSYNVGDMMIVKDHVNFLGMAGNHPLRGANDDDFGPRFFSVNYDVEVRTKTIEMVSKESYNSKVREGILGIVGGPNYETLAEINYLRTIGVDAIGMSVIPEVMVGCHCGIRCFAVSLVTNKYARSYEDAETPNHAEVLKAGKEGTVTMIKLVKGVVGIMGSVEKKAEK